MSKSDVTHLILAVGVLAGGYYFVFMRGKVKPVHEWSMVLAVSALLTATAWYMDKPVEATFLTIIFLGLLASYIQARRDAR